MIWGGGGTICGFWICGVKGYNIQIYSWEGKTLCWNFCVVWLFKNAYAGILQKCYQFNIFSYVLPHPLAQEARLPVISVLWNITIWTLDCLYFQINGLNNGWILLNGICEMTNDKSENKDKNLDKMFILITAIFPNQESLTVAQIRFQFENYSSQFIHWQIFNIC